MSDKPGISFTPWQCITILGFGVGLLLAVAGYFVRELNASDDKHSTSSSRIMAVETTVGHINDTLLRLEGKIDAIANGLHHRHVGE